MNKSTKEVRFDFVSIALMALAILLVFLSFFMPYLITNWSLIEVDFLKTGPIGDSIGGLMNPFIGIAGIAITFLAFYIQFQANKQQRELFSLQIEEDKKQFKLELVEQREQFQKNQFENQFYEMIRLHKENVNDIFVNIVKYTNTDRKEYNLYGRKTFEFFLDEIEIVYEVAKRVYIREHKNNWLKYAYSLVFHGLKFNKEIEPNNYQSEDYCKFINILIRIKLGHKRNLYKGLRKHSLRSYINDVNFNFIPNNDLNYDLFTGYSNFLGHYYRQLFLTVKFIISQSLFSYEDKRKYLRILRAQLTNHEQVMLFYNWKSGFGTKWENDKNKFFTDYRMIHNIYNNIIIKDFSLIEEFNLNVNANYKKENGRDNDPLFEFEDN